MHEAQSLDVQTSASPAACCGHLSAAAAAAAAAPRTPTGVSNTPSARSLPRQLFWLTGSRLLASASRQRQTAWQRQQGGVRDATVSRQRRPRHHRAEAWPRRSAPWSLCCTSCWQRAPRCCWHCTACCPALSRRANEGAGGAGGGALACNRGCVLVQATPCARVPSLAQRAAPADPLCLKPCLVS